MSIRYKFRSAVNFDTVEIGDRGSISVSELRTRILRGKNLQQQQQGFDLVFLDAVSGLDIKGDDYQILSGASVVVKRVPCGTVPSAMPTIQAGKDVLVKQFRDVNPIKETKDELDDFGADLCPLLNPKLPHSDQEISKNNVVVGGTKGFTGLRLEAQNLNLNDLNQAVPKVLDSNQPTHQKNLLLEARVHEQKKLKSSNFLALQNANMPLEMKCSLCNTFFKEAVMIPCCQHSFCKKCIHLALVEDGKCPKCLSDQCKAEDLLPNLSLRHAIDHFLESDIIDDILENHDMQKHVPDGESGIQVGDPCCALTVVQRESEILQSSCATGKGSNQIFESYNEYHPNGNLPVADSADSNAKKKVGFWVDARGEDRNFPAPTWHKKGVRNCYTCGSPDHLMRNCPAFSGTPNFQPGNEAFNGGMPAYAHPYWNSSSLPHFRPFAQMYSNHAMLPFNASNIPVPPFSLPLYISSTRDGLPGPGGNIVMGNMGLPGQSNFFQLEHCESRRKHSNENLERSGKDSQNDKHLDSNFRHADERYEKGSHSSLVGREKKWHHVERSNSSAADVPRSSDRHSEGRHKHHFRDSKKYHERIGHFEPSHHSTQRGLKRRAEHDIRDSHKKHDIHAESVFELSAPTDCRRGYKERDTDHDSRPSRHSSKHAKDELQDDKCKIINSSDRDYRDGHCYNKRKRIY